MASRGANLDDRYPPDLAVRPFPEHGLVRNLVHIEQSTAPVFMASLTPPDALWALPPLAGRIAGIDAI